MPATRDQQISFRDKTAEIFAAIDREFKINPKISLIQSAEESNWGLSQLAVNGLNIFSMTAGSEWIKAKRGEIPMETVANWSSLGKETIDMLCWEHHNLPPEKIRWWDIPGDIQEKKPDGKGGSIVWVNRYFRKYANWKESSWDWARRIARAPQYKFAYAAAQKGDIVEYAAAIQASGYATDKNYAHNLIQFGRAILALEGVG